MRVAALAAAAFMRQVRITSHESRITAVDMLPTCNYPDRMSIMVQIRNVPSDLHRELKSRAALEGMSLSDYLLRELRHALDRPTLDEMRKRLARRQPVQPRPAPAAAVRAVRNSR
jgi:antitoxin FitA